MEKQSLYKAQQIHEKNADNTYPLQHVISTVSDRAIPQEISSSGNVSFYQADIKSYSDYYPFGMQMPGRFETAAGHEYRYGMQGQESDNEMDGSKSYYSFKYRIHDARIGRFLSIDPLRNDYPWNSTYAFAENDVIRAIDLEGAEKLIITGKQNLGFRLAMAVVKQTEVWKEFERIVTDPNINTKYDVYIVEATTKYQMEDKRIDRELTPEGTEENMTRALGVTTIIKESIESDAFLIDGIDETLSEGRQAIVIKLNKEFSEFATEKAFSNQEVTENAVKRLAFVILHEADAHAKNYILDKKKTQAEEHAEFNGADFYKNNHPNKSPLYKDVKDNTRAGEVKKQVEESAKSVGKRLKAAADKKIKKNSYEKKQSYIGCVIHFNSCIL